jgi:hypothetical protein
MYRWFTIAVDADWLCRHNADRIENTIEELVVNPRFSVVIWAFAIEAAKIAYGSKLDEDLRVPLASILE